MQTTPELSDELKAESEFYAAEIDRRMAEVKAIIEELIKQQRAQKYDQ